MKREDEPITDDEWLIRLVWHDRVTSRTPIISPNSFQPRPDEAAGISLFRRSCVPDPSDALIPIREEKRNRYALVLVSVRLMRRLGFTATPTPIEEVPGHVLVPEINPEAYRSQKPQLLTSFLELANEASANIIRRPLIV